MDYENDIKIDENSLDLEWLDQPSLMMKYCRHQAEMQEEEERAREKLDLIKAELDLDIRSDPDKYAITKITEAVVSGAILMSDKYKKVNEEYLKAKFENNVAKGAVRSIDQRKVALENLVRLHGQQYFAGPKVPRDLSWERKQKQERSDQSITINKPRRRK